VLAGSVAIAEPDHRETGRPNTHGAEGRRGARRSPPYPYALRRRGGSPGLAPRTASCSGSWTGTDDHSRSLQHHRPARAVAGCLGCRPGWLVRNARAGQPRCRRYGCHTRCDGPSRGDWCRRRRGQVRASSRPWWRLGSRRYRPLRASGDGHGHGHGHGSHGMAILAIALLVLLRKLLGRSARRVLWMLKRPVRAPAFIGRDPDPHL